MARFLPVSLVFFCCTRHSLAHAGWWTPASHERPAHRNSGLATHEITRPPGKEAPA
ncbi:MAG: hypothetical protein GYA24_25000 [Candidatus Lokiarchaeota archaeon]|nr:hypothetical protein [Candidatus Lokiarchaeota archaeon]